MLATILLLGLTAAAAVTDLARHKIYNWTTYSGIAAALALSAGGWLALAQGWTDEITLRNVWGWIPLGQCLLGLLVCGGPMLVCFAMFRLGGGDVKLMAMFGAFMGPDQGLIAMLLTFVLGATAAVIVLIWRFRPLRLLTLSLQRLFWTLRLGQWQPLTDEERAMLQPPLYLAPCALAAAAVVKFGLL
jgi:prepilin peptidase CpaA